MRDASENALDLSQLRLFAADRVGPFFRRILDERKDLVVALHVIGSAVTEDFDPGRSDINSMIVLREVDFGFLDLLGALCRKFAESRIRPPMLMTPKYIERWRDLSPVELLDLKLINVRVWGADLLSGVEIDRASVRLQCGRELRQRLVQLGWGYVDAAGGKRELTDLLQRSVSGLAPLVRGILYAKGDQPPIAVAPLFDALSGFVGGVALSFKEVYWMKLRGVRMPVSRVRETLRDYYRAIEVLIDVVDQMAVPRP